MTFALQSDSIVKLRYALPLIAALTFVFSTPTQAKLDIDHVNHELASANTAVNQGHVKEGIESLTNLLRSIDPSEEKDAYWRTSTLLIELLSQVEDHSSASQVINTLILGTKVTQSQTAYFQWRAILLR
jgi:hypothetical protein